MITGVDRAVFIKYNTGALSTGAIRGENSGGPKKISPYIIHSAGYISFWSFEISEDFLRNQKFIIGLDSFFLPMFNIFGPIWKYTTLCFDYHVERCKISVILFGSMLRNLKGHCRDFNSRNRGMAHALSH